MQFTELRNKTNEQKEYFTKEIETLKKNQMNIIQEWKNSANEMKTSLGSFGNRAELMEERIIKLEDRILEITRAEEKKKTKTNKRNFMITI